jgi:hypothetical protein
MVIKLTPKVLIKVEQVLIVEDHHKTFQLEERDLRRYVEKMDGIHTSNQFRSTMNKYMGQ